MAVEGEVKGRNGSDHVMRGRHLKVALLAGALLASGGSHQVTCLCAAGRWLRLR